MDEKKVIDPELVDSKYSKHYSDSGLKEKLVKYGGMIGKEILLKVFELYYIMKDPTVPGKAKVVIAAALGYFILPLDIIPDILPVVGYADDVAAIGAALAFVSQYRTEEVKLRAQAKFDELFG